MATVRDWLAGMLITRRGRVGLGAGIGLVLGLAVAGLFLLDVFERFELQSYDLRFRIRGPRPPRPDVVIVGLDEESTRRAGFRAGDWPRRLHGEVI
ncbi:MAG: CHASE2 domain-containing protein, partial [Candidatus Rokuibacteriota bacterium]